MAIKIFKIQKIVHLLICSSLLGLGIGLTACSSTPESPAPESEDASSTSAVEEGAFVSPVESVSPSPTPVSTSSPLATPPPTVSPEVTYEVTIESLTTLAGEVQFDNKTIYYITTPVYGPLVLTGIAADGEEIWIVNNETDSIFSVDSITGDVSQTFAFPEALGVDPSVSGLAWDGENFWIADAQGQTIFQYDARFQLALNSFVVDYPPGDLAWDGDSVWVVKRETSELQNWSPEGELLETQTVPGPWITGLTWGADRLWYSDVTEKTVHVWNPETAAGEVIIVDALAEHSFGGLGWQNNSLLLLDDLGGRLLSFDVDEFEFVN